MCISSRQYTACFTQNGVTRNISAGRRSRIKIMCVFFFLKIRRFLRINDIQTRKIRKIRTIERWRILIVLRSTTRSTNFESNFRIFTLVAHVSPRKLKLSQTETPIIDTRFEWFLISFVYYEISFSIVKMSQDTAPSNVCYKRIRLVFFLIFRKVWERIDFFFWWLLLFRFTLNVCSLDDFWDGTKIPDRSKRNHTIPVCVVNRRVFVLQHNKNV